MPSTPFTRMNLVHLVCDYGPGDGAWSEMKSAIACNLTADWTLQDTSIHSFDTIGTGFWVAQLGLADRRIRPERTIIFANCAPRRDRKAPRKNNAGEGLLYGELKNGVHVIAVNSGYSLSFVKRHLKSLYKVNVRRDSSQFRSRDIFPPVVGLVAAEDFSFCAGRVDPRGIPDFPRGVVGYVDSFGNIKTTFQDGDRDLKGLKEGQIVRLCFGNRPKFIARVATGSFNISEGEIAFAPGSSGHQKRFWEIFLRGGNAWEHFGRPEPGALIGIEKA